MQKMERFLDKPLFSLIALPTILFLSPLLIPVDKGSQAGPHGEGGLAGPSDLQGDRDDQRGELLSAV